ncbi:hypothetical protein BM523_08620 [Alteromonas mediterranea]|uniref:hypothetical protein n=1 Tax=Alteromonas mediterranea TaxID=314275 RepID=UPI0009038722|nr:hypothetical protein [Alteromonas mediterranea]APD94048.1 hypothetical protein BM523_08620 [Alteromonas mediterranea]APD97680.1 hypothetical protein BM525_08685 [Alteromonas mediterranea]
MKFRSRVLLKYLGLLPIVLLLIVVSILGENHRANELVENYLESLKMGFEAEKCIPLNFKSSSDVVKKLTCEDQSFLFLLSLMKTLELKDFGSIRYTTDLSEYWTPFRLNNYVSVHVTFENLSENTLSNIIFVVERDGLSWTINKIDVNNKELVSVYDEFKALDLSRYIEVSGDTLEIKSNHLKVGSLSYIDRMVIKYNLQRLNNYLKDN